MIVKTMNLKDLLKLFFDNSTQAEELRRINEENARLRGLVADMWGLDCTTETPCPDCEWFDGSEESCSILRRMKELGVIG